MYRGSPIIMASILSHLRVDQEFLEISIHESVQRLDKCVLKMFLWEHAISVSQKFGTINTYAIVRETKE